MIKETQQHDWEVWQGLVDGVAVMAPIQILFVKVLCHMVTAICVSANQQM